MKKELSISAIKEGTAIDHIPSNVTFKVADILDIKGIRSVISVANNLIHFILSQIFIAYLDYAFFPHFFAGEI